jgi:hypothetical protein
MKTRYYAFANNQCVIDSENLKWIIETLKGFYSDLGTVTIIDQNRTLVKTLNLKEHHYETGQPNQMILSAINQGIYNNYINYSVGYAQR